MEKMNRRNFLKGVAAFAIASSESGSAKAGENGNPERTQQQAERDAQQDLDSFVKSMGTGGREVWDEVRSLPVHKASSRLSQLMVSGSTEQQKIGAKSLYWAQQNVRYHHRDMKPLPSESLEQYLLRSFREDFLQKYPNGLPE